MAKIIKQSEHLKNEYIKEHRNNIKTEENNKRATFKMLLVVAILDCAFLVTGLLMESMVMTIPFVIIFSFVLITFISLSAGGRVDKSDEEKLRAGIIGEERFANLLSTLPDEYTVFQDVKITFEGKTSEIDNIVVGRSGVFVIETKNIKGIITGDYNDRNWTRTKIGRGGTAYYKDFYSPVKQVRTHIYRLSNYLRDKGIHTYIEGLVCFTNLETEIEVFGEGDIPVLSISSSENIISYILNGDKNLSDALIDRICSLIEKSI